MSCKCIDNLEKALTDKHGEIEFTNLAYTINIKTGKETVKPPCIEYNFHPLKKDGTYSKKKSKGGITYRYCPICGMPYEESNEPTK